MAVRERHETQENTPSQPRLSRRNMLQATGAVAMGGMATLPFSAIRASAQETWDRETDVVVVGTGASGTPAAIEAARAGAQVLRLEKVAATGGNMSHSQGIIYLGGGTDLQKLHGFEDTIDGMVAYLEAFMGPWEDPEFIRFYAENSVDHYNWLVGEGVPFGEEFTADKVVTAPNGGLSYCGNEVNYPYNEITPPIPRAHCVVGNGAAMSVALQASADAEPNITTEVNAPVTNLIVDDSGRVIGVVAQIDGQPQHILARRGVILTSGGYEMNDEMLQQTTATGYPIVGVGSAYRGNTGDGIRMAASLGSRLRDMDLTFSTPFVYPPNERVHAILINSKGRRFVNEASYGAVLGDIIIGQERNIAWLVMDSATAEAVAGAGGDVSEPYAMADTWEEIAAAIDVPAAVLINEITFYNEQARAGSDPAYRKSEEFLTPLETAPFLVFN
ncbi:MAG: FAD-binding protein, partial [Thermomicrobiales bacterium]